MSDLLSCIPALAFTHAELLHSLREHQRLELQRLTAQAEHKRAQLLREVEALKENSSRDVPHPRPHTHAQLQRTLDDVVEIRKQHLEIAELKKQHARQVEAIAGQAEREIAELREWYARQAQQEEQNKQNALREERDGESGDHHLSDDCTQLRLERMTIEERVSGLEKEDEIMEWREEARKALL